MDGSNGISDAEMRLIMVNGQTIMLEGDFENINITNEFLNEMLMVNGSKVDISQANGVQVDENSCINCEKETNDEISKLQISIRGENNELEMVQIGVEEAKALGLCLHEYKNDDVSNSLNCASNGLLEEAINESSGKIIEKLEEESNRVKLHSVPVVNLDCLNKEPNTVLYVNDTTKPSENSEFSETCHFGIDSKVDKSIKTFQDDSADSLPAIGHLEGFQIPTSEDELLLPATVNAKMVDGSYQTITLVPQVVNGSVTYTVHFSHLPKEVLDGSIKSPNSNRDEERVNNNMNSLSKESTNEITSVEEFLSSVQLIKNSEVKKVLQDDLNKLNNCKAMVTDFTKSLGDDLISKSNSVSCESGKSGELSVNYTYQNQLAIDAKIDNLISENENVISRCKKVKYGKKIKSIDADSSFEGLIKMPKNNITKAKKVKFKGKGLKFLNDEMDKKKQKYSLLKPNNDHTTKLEITNRGTEKEKIVNACQMPHMNLNGRLEYPNLKAIDETDSSLSFLKVKSPNLTKLPYFNVLPYPKTKGIPVQKQILPLNCDLQQAKNLISLQKFLETQKLQLKIQPIVSNGNKIVNIRPKPTGSEEIKVGMLGSINSKQVPNKYREKLSINEIPKEVKTQENESVNKSYQQNNLDVKEIFLNDGKLNNLKFLKPHSPKPAEDDSTKNDGPDCTNKLNGIFIKNNPEYFSPKLKNGKIDEHPLGSSENPIQLVQTGHTFHSRQPLSEAQLQQIASILQKQKFDSPSIKKNSIFDPKTNTRIVYRVVYPEDVELKGTDKGSIETVNKKKRGRHKTKFGIEDDIQKKPQMPRGPGRPKKTLVSVLEEDALEEEIEDTIPKKKIPRTRSGRLSRPPRYMVKDYKRLHNSDNSEKTSNSNYEPDEVYSSFQNGKKVTLEGRTDNLSNLEIDSNLLPGLRPQQRSKRNFKPEYRCPTCQKIYLGHTRMMWHLNKFPDHCNVEKYKENYYRKRSETKVRRAARRLNMCDVTNKVKQVLNTMAKDELISSCGPRLADALTTWDFLLLRVNLLKKSKKDEVDALIHELILLLEKLTKVAEDIFLPVFTKESEKDGDCVEIDRMEVAIALGLPVGFYKVNNDNLNLLRYPLTNSNQEAVENKKFEGNDNNINVDSEKLFSPDDNKELFQAKTDSWKEYKGEENKLDDDRSFWLENKGGDDSGWHQPGDSIKTLSTKFEPNLSSKLLESLNDSIEDGKYEEPETLINLDTNSKDTEQDNSSENLIESPDIALKKNERKISDIVGEITHQCENEDKSSLWNENSTDKAPEDLWTESAVETKSSSALWPNDNSNLTAETEKRDDSHLWKESSNLTVSEKVDETNSEFLDSLLSVPSSNEFLSGNPTGNFLAENIPFENKAERIKQNDSVNVLVDKVKCKNKWRTNDGDEGNYMRVWNTAKGPTWPKEESILSGSVQERMPGVRTTARLTSTPESNGSVSFNISNRRNSISDFSNINLESTNLDVVLPSAKTLIKDCLKSNEGKFELKENSFLQDSENYKIKNWQNDSGKADFSSTNVNSEELMKMALESLTSQHDVMNVAPSGFDSAIGILNQNQETANLNLFATGETDALDFNLPLPDHLLRTNFTSGNFQSPCEQGGGTNFQNSESSSFLGTPSNIFGPSCALPNTIKFDDQFETNFAVKKSKSLDDVMEFFEAKASYNGFETGTESSTINTFPFTSDPTQENGYAVSSESLESSAKKKKKSKLKKTIQKRVRKTTKKTKCKKAVDYPKGNSIESIINEALFESCSSGGKSSSLQMKHSSPNHNSAIATASENYSLPIISESLDEVENLDFLGQD